MADPIPPIPAVPWSRILEIAAKSSMKEQVVRIWHPKPEAPILEGGAGSIEVLAGPAAYQLTTGIKKQI